MRQCGYQAEQAAARAHAVNTQWTLQWCASRQGPHILPEMHMTFIGYPCTDGDVRRHPRQSRIVTPTVKLAVRLELSGAQFSAQRSNNCMLLSTILGALTLLLFVGMAVSRSLA